MFQPDSSETPLTVNGGPLGNPQYQLSNIHFHWGSVSSQGSEHTLEGKRYPMEVHMVHIKQEYGNLSNALEHEDGLAVLGFFMEIGNASKFIEVRLMVAVAAMKIGSSSSSSSSSAKQKQ
jgi:carbonic anhydrase